MVFLSTIPCACWPSVCLLWKDVFSDPLLSFEWVCLLIYFAPELYVSDMNSLAEEF